MIVAVCSLLQITAQTPDAKMKTFVAGLMAKMTLEEKDTAS